MNIKNLKAIFWSSRPVSWINTAFPFAAAYLVMAGTVDARLIIGTLYFLIPYNLLMYGVNDVFDYESDVNNPRKGGIEGAKLDKTTHKPILIAAALLNIPFVAVLLFLSDEVFSGLVLAAVVFFVLAYSVPKLRFKEIPFLDSVTSSLHFVGPAIYAFSLTGFSSSIVIVLLAFFCWGMASHAFGAVQDVKSDKTGGIGSIATVIGPGATVKFALVLYTLSALLVLSLGLPSLSLPLLLTSFSNPTALETTIFSLIFSWQVLIITLAVLAYAVNIFPYRRVSDSNAHTANRAWRRFIYLNFATGAIVTIVLMHSTFGQ